MQSHAVILLVVAVVFSGWYACSSKRSGGTAEPYVLNLPANLDHPMPIPRHNTTTKAGVLLGNKLFFDPILSANNQISCASCHQPDKAFSDGLSLSQHGLSGKPLLRHVPQLTNVGWYEGYFWEGGAKNLESLVFGPLTHPDEMGQDLHQVNEELSAHAEYPTLFRKAFGKDTVHASLAARALAQYMRTLISADSRYDLYVRNENTNALTQQELQGMHLTQEKCGSCHAFEPGKRDFFTDFSYHNNGLDSIYADGKENLWKGRFRITFDSTQIGAYKTPTLRNLPLTAPYMHDGRFATLKEVLHHYRFGIKPSPFLDSLLTDKKGKVGIEMSDYEQQAIIAFLGSLQGSFSF